MPLHALRALRLSAALSLSLGLVAAPAAGAADKPAARKIAPAKAAAQKPPKAKARKAEAPHLPFVEGDYDKALADAKARSVPLVVDVWAPW